MLDTPSHPKPPEKKYVTANGHDDLNKIATENHTTEGEIIRLNIALAHYEGSKKPVKKGTRVRVS
jgi:LysM repeat protein